nr:hypothetical protein [Tanacetum cinerariifolium]
LEVSMDRDNQEALHETLTTSRKRRPDDQFPPPPPLKDSDRSKKKKQDSDASASQQPQAQTALYDLRAVRSHMKILSVVSLKTFSRYGYTYLKEIVLRRADYQGYKISEADFKNLHPNDFEDMYMLHLKASSTNYLDQTKFPYLT